VNPTHRQGKCRRAPITFKSARNAYNHLEVQSRPEPAPPARTHPVIVALSILTVCYGVAFAGSQATFGGLGWYAGIRKPAWTPPSWLFGPVWTILYALMGFAAIGIWHERRPGRGLALGAFGIQLLLNGLWPFLFFAWHLLAWSAAEIAVLWLAIGVTAYLFATLRPRSAWLLAPYLAWTTFAGILNMAIWQMNR